MATRQPAKQPRFTAAQLTKAIKDDDAARKAKRAAKRAAKREAEKAEHDAKRAAQEQREAEAMAARDKTAEQTAYLEALRVDWEALGQPGTFEQYVAENATPGEDPAPREDQPKAKRERHYFGSMYALVQASKAYVKAKNGILCNGDQLAMECGKYSRQIVVEGLKNALIAAKVLEGNPYLHLNPGQQSMNMRNKARAALKDGNVSMASIAAHLKAESDRSTAK